MKYIDSEKLIAEIDKKWKELADKNVKVGGGKYDIEISTYLTIKNLITSFQQDHEIIEFSFKGGTYKVDGEEKSFKGGNAKVIVLEIKQEEGNE